MNAEFVMDNETFPAVISFGWYNVRFEYPMTERGQKLAVQNVCLDLKKLADCLPHGSGIDGNYTVIVLQNGDIKINSSFHEMDQHGYYCGWRNFGVKIGRAKVNRWTKLRGPCEGQFQITQKAGNVYLQAVSGGGRNRDYLYDLLSTAIAYSLGIRSMESGMTVNSQAEAEGVSL